MAHQGSYRRVLLKISGESFCGPDGYGVEPDALKLIATEIVAATEIGIQLAVVVGGGNIVRGTKLAEAGHIPQSTADYMGMLGTVINGLGLKEMLHTMGKEARLMSAINLTSVAEPFIRARAIRHLEKGRVVILAAGTGNPFFTTDSCAALRGRELDADVVLKATKVDGVYDTDPAKTPNAKRFEEISFRETMERQLKVMDMTAVSLCMEQQLPVVVFDFRVKGNIKRAAMGERIGTIIH
ncbi:MAG: UMP kinase [Phycisphaerales bacterium]|nr:UMP kinase [Phycisphaerales bacterium]